MPANKIEQGTLLSQEQAQALAGRYIVYGQMRKKIFSTFRDAEVLLSYTDKGTPVIEADMIAATKVADLLAIPGVFKKTIEELRDTLLVLLQLSSYDLDIFDASILASEEIELLEGRWVSFRDGENGLSEKTLLTKLAKLEKYLRETQGIQILRYVDNIEYFDAHTLASLTEYILEKCYITGDSLHYLRKMLLTAVEEVKSEAQGSGDIQA